MATEDGLDIVYGSTKHSSSLFNGIIDCLKAAAVKGTFYIGYPVMASADSSTTIDALLVSRSPGLVAFHISDGEIDIREHQDHLYYVLNSNLGRHDSLRTGRELGIKINIISIFPSIADFATSDDPNYLTADPNSLKDALPKMQGIPDESLYHRVCAAIQRVTTIKPQKKRQGVKSSDSKGAILKRIEKEIANLDRWQKAAAIETPEGPQRIRGLAGSGKTVILALKAAYLHTQYPDWKIAVTFHTRSLYQQFRDLIERFTLEHMGDKPNWDNLKILHSWGSYAGEGLYSIVCSSINLPPYSYLSAKAKYGTRRAFEGACNELAAALNDRPIDIFDAVLIDEAQDLPASFFKIVDHITKPPKRIVWAYDELQNLSETGMASPPELFGRSLDLASNPTEPKRDIILPVCYRNTPWALTLAHALGFGLFRDPTLIQHFDEPGMWTDIGYNVADGELEFESEVTLERSDNSYPPYFKDLLVPDDAVVYKGFNDSDQQYAWIAEEISKNVKEDELDPDDMLIILPQAITQKNEYYQLRRHLETRGIESMLAGVTNDLDLFTQPGVVTVSGIYRAKGNEAPMVYIANAEYTALGHEMIKLRNILFTGITRSRAWVRICGVGEQMEMLITEIQKVISNGYKLKFRIPSIPELQLMRRINRDRTAHERTMIRKVQKNLDEILDLVRKGVISPDAMPQIKELIRAANISDEEE